MSGYDDSSNTVSYPRENSYGMRLTLLPRVVGTAAAEGTKEATVASVLALSQNASYVTDFAYSPVTITIA